MKLPHRTSITPKTGRHQPPGAPQQPIPRQDIMTKHAEAYAVENRAEVKLWAQQAKPFDMTPQQHVYAMHRDWLDNNNRPPRQPAAFYRHLTNLIDDGELPGWRTGVWSHAQNHRLFGKDASADKN